MKAQYDFSKGKKNPYSKQLKKQITINLSEEVLDYFKELSKETSVPYQTLINFYLLDCVKNKKKMNISFDKKWDTDSTSKNVLFVYITCHIHLRM